MPASQQQTHRSVLIGGRDSPTLGVFGAEGHGEKLGHRRPIPRVPVHASFDEGMELASEGTVPRQTQSIEREHAFGKAMGAFRLPERPLDAGQHLVHEQPEAPDVCLL
eukprot:3934231-Rhodomonas_salina.3